jgi:WhiB family redox-sensing transcriptional regulator
VNTTWVAEAACKDAETSEPWFPTDAGHDYSAGRAVCASCPVRRDCLEYALRLEQSGIPTPGLWGGRDEAERRGIRRARILAAS